MARKARDYKAEERRRKELAQARGYTNRYAQRKAIETGKAPALQPSRLRKPETIAAQKRVRKSPAKARPARKTPPPPKRPKGGLKVFTGGLDIPDAQLCQDYSDYAAGTEMAEYRPENAKSLGVTRAEYTEAYFNAFVNPETRYSTFRYSGGTDYLYYWFVILNKYYTAAEYENKY